MVSNLFNIKVNIGVKSLCFGVKVESLFIGYVSKYLWSRLLPGAACSNLYLSRPPGTGTLFVDPNCCKAIWARPRGT